MEMTQREYDTFNYGAPDKPENEEERRVVLINTYYAVRKALDELVECGMLTVAQRNVYLKAWSHEHVR